MRDRAIVIEELRDVMVLIGELPRGEQLKCARALWALLDEWEERQQHPELSDDEWRELQADRAAARRTRDELAEWRECGLSVELRSGAVESFDRETGCGLIRMEHGEPASLHITCLRAAGHRDIAVGTTVEFLALLRPGQGWQVLRIVSLSGVQC